MNTQNVWIKRSEREPQPAEFPVLYGHYYQAQWEYAVYYCGNTVSSVQTHWRSIKADPPARELTQRERDLTLARNIALGCKGNYTEMVLEGIYAERREVAKLMEEIHGRVAWEHGAMWNDGLVKLRARLDEQGAK